MLALNAARDSLQTYQKHHFWRAAMISFVDLAGWCYRELADEKLESAQKYHSFSSVRVLAVPSLERLDSGTVGGANVVSSTTWKIVIGLAAVSTQHSSAA